MQKVEFVRIIDWVKLEAPDDIPEPNTFNKLVIENMNKMEEDSAFYISHDTEVS